MSKGNMLLGYARGKVGDVVMARALGKQQTRAYNDKPKNPKTESQMNQRVKMLNLINFYKFSKNYLQYEKGGSNTKYSTFNKFVRYNIATTPNYLTKEEFLNNVTIPNSYYYSIGSLPWNCKYSIGSDGSAQARFDFGVGPNAWNNLPPAGSTIKETLRAFFKAMGAKTDNAILTLFFAKTDANGNVTDSTAVSINIDKLTNVDGVTPAQGVIPGIEVAPFINVGTIAESYKISFNLLGITHSDMNASAACWSFVDQGRLKVSTSKIVLSEDLASVVTADYQTDEARINAINSYKVGEPIELRTGTPAE